ncbi:MAG: hypothetical protein AAF557_10905 [Pseudomonadota bacterium]
MPDARNVPVILIHGLGRGTGSMLPLDWRLRRRGWRTTRIGYASTRMGLAQSIEAVRAEIPATPCHLIGHSLGGLITAALIRDRQDLQIVRAVQLGSPNLGSALAVRAHGLAPVRWACGPAIQDIQALTDAPEVHHDIGAIAGTGGWALPGTGLERPHDGAVSVRSASAGANHCALVPVLHTLLPASAAVARLADSFLAEGAFPKEGA